MAIWTIRLRLGHGWFCIRSSSRPRVWYASRFRGRFRGLWLGRRHIVRAGDQIPSCCKYLAAAWVRLSTPIFSKRFLRWNFTVLSEMSSFRAS